MKFLIILCEVIILGATYQVAAELSDKFYIRHLAPPEGPGYDLFYYDGISLRDEKWRFDYANQDTAVHRRFGLKDDKSSQFHVVDTLSDANGFRQKTRILSDPRSIDSLLAVGIEPPTTLETFQKYGTMPRIKLRDNSHQEGQPRDPTLGFLNGVTLGVTLNRPTTPGDSYIQGFVSTGLGAQNGRPGLQFGIPNLGILPGSRPSNDSPVPIKSPFGFPFFGNNAEAPAQTAPPPQSQPSLFGFPFGNREPPPPPPVQPSPPQQPNFFAGFQNLNIPFIGQPQTTTTPQPIVPTTNPSLFANFPNFGFQNNNKPLTTIVTTTTTLAPQGPFANLQFPFPNFGQTTISTTTAPETTTTIQRPFGFSLPNISGFFQNNNGKGADKNKDNRFNPPGHAHGHRHPPNHPQNRPEHQAPKHPHRKPQPSLPPYQNEGGPIVLEPGIIEQSPEITTEKVISSTFEYNEFFPASEDVTQKLSNVFTPPPTTVSPTVDKLVTRLPIETGLLQSNAVAPSTDPDIPPPKRKPFVEPLVSVVDKNSYALGIQETSTNSFSNVEPVKPFSISPVSSSRSDDIEQTTFIYIPADLLPTKSKSSTKLQPTVTDQTTTENFKISINKDTDEIISDINDLSNNPPFPTLAFAVQDPPPNALPYPLLDLAPPFETEPGDLGIHEDLLLSKISSPESSNTAIPTVPGIIELIRQSKNNISNEILTQTEIPVTDSTLLDQNSPSSMVKSKSDEIIGINTLKSMNSVMLPETDILPPFENEKEDVLTKEKTITETATTLTSIQSNLVNTKFSNIVLPPEIDLLPPVVSDTIEITQRTTPKASAISTTEPTKPIASAVSPAIDLLPPFNRASGMEITEIITQAVPQPDVYTIKSTTTTHTTVPTTESGIILVKVNNLRLPETDLLPPFEENLVSKVINIEEPSTTTNQPKSTTSQTTTSTPSSISGSKITTTITTAPPLVQKANITAPEIDLLPPFLSISITQDEKIKLGGLSKNENTVKFTTISFPSTTSTTISPINSDGLNKVIPPETDLLPPFERKSVSEVIENIQRIANTNKPMTTTTTTTSRITPSRHTTMRTTPVPEITSATVAKPPVSANISNITTPEIDLVPSFQSNPIVDVEKTTLAVVSIKENAPITATIKSPTSASTIKTRFNTDDSNNVIAPEIDLLPPFEGNSIPDVTKNIQLATTTTTTTTTNNNNNKPEPIATNTSTPRTNTNRQTSLTSISDLKIISTTASPPLLSVILNNVTAPEVDLLPPFQSTPNAGVKENTLTVSTIDVNKSTNPIKVPPTTASRVSLNKLNNVKQPETDLLPPLVENTTPNVIENTTSKPTANKPNTSTSSTTSQPATVISREVLADLEKVIVPDIDILPPFKSSSTTTNKPKPPTSTTTLAPRITFKTQGKIEKVPEIDLLPPFEATITTAIPATSRTTINNIIVTTKAATPHPIIQLPDLDLLPPLESNSVTRQQLVSTAATLRTTNSPTTTTPNIPKTIVTTTPHTVTDKKVEPIYQRITTALPIKQPEIDLLPPRETGNNIVSAIITETSQPLSTVVPIVSEIKSRLTENQLTESVPPFNGTNFNQFANQTNILLLIANRNSTAPSAKSSALVESPEVLSQNITTDIKPLLTRIDIDTTMTTVPRITKVTTPRTISTTTSTPLTSTDNLITVVIAKPSKFFLPPFETPVHKLVLNTSSSILSERYNYSTTNELPKQLDQSTIRVETDKIVDSVRKIIEHTSQSILPTVPTDFMSEPQIRTSTPTTRYERSSTTSQQHHNKPAFLRSAPNLEARHKKHKFHPHGGPPGHRLVPPPKRKPGEVDVYSLETDIRQGGQSLNGPFSYPQIQNQFYSNTNNLNPSSVDPFLSSIQNPTENVFMDQLTTEVPMLSVVDNQMTTKAAIKRPIFVNVDDESDTETTTSILDIKLSPNAIKSLIG